MILHAGGEKWEISAKTILNIEAIMIKKRTGLDYAEWMDALGEFNVEALTAFVWVAKKRENPTLKFEEVSFELGSIDFEWNEEELAEQKEALEAQEAEKEGRAVPKDEDSLLVESD